MKCPNCLIESGARFFSVDELGEEKEDIRRCQPHICPKCGWMGEYDTLRKEWIHENLEVDK